MGKRFLSLSYCSMLACMLFNVASSQESPHGKLSFACNSCHSTESWKMKKDPSFDHASTGFAIGGQHAGAKCVSCHQALRFAERTSSNCVACHTDVHKSELGADCMRCHSANAWKISDMKQKHQSTRFPLLGRHVTLECQACHTNVAQKQYAGVPVDCIGCHRTTFVSTKTPPHAASGFSTNCVECHEVTSLSWGTGFDHARTTFPLMGAHAATSCFSCHKNQVFKSTPTQCVACHQTDYNAAANPNHRTGNFPTQCQTCHGQATWRPATFNHANTGFPLTGAHQAVACTQCHANNQYTNTPTSCIGCHQTAFNSTTNPNHRTGNFSTDCVRCHTTSAWRPATFNHATTRFALSGRHASVQCIQCHTNNNYQLVYTDCFQCHQTQYNQPTNPRHVLPSFAYDCTPCHATSAWGPSSFDHNTTRFRLTGQHIGRGCNDCHVNNVYRNLPSTCWDCHANDFDRTTNPNHVQRTFSHDCTQCHSTNGWGGGSFDHATTNFALTGAHIATGCAACHVNGNYQLQYTNCYPCHTQQFTQPTNPNHILGNFNHDCVPCHTTTVWRPSTFSHANTTFPLVGAHQAVSCNQCHTNNQYQLPHSCFDCHATDFNGTTNPNHVAGQFSRECLQCHAQSAWRPATFDHAATNFRLTGAHTATACASCHVNGNYTLTYTDCYQCHAPDYAVPTNPNHVQWQLSRDCTPCHTTTAWRPSTYNHDTQFFRIYSGHHNGRWQNNCQNCHPTIGQYQNYTCTTSCHPRAEMDSRHANRQGYVYSTPECYRCHRNS